MGTRSDAKQRKVLEAKHRLKTLSGRERKDRAMKIAREMATRGGFDGWSHVLTTYEAQHPDDSSLRIWASASDQSEIDRICERWRKAQPKQRR